MIDNTRDVISSLSIIVRTIGGTCVISIRDGLSFITYFPNIEPKGQMILRHAQYLL